MRQYDAMNSLMRQREEMNMQGRLAYLCVCKDLRCV